MLSKFVAYASLAGIVVTLSTAGPAAAVAAAPTLSGPAYGVGFGQITLEGTAAPGATVRLFETARIWNDLQPADDWENGGGPVTAVADAGGRYQIRRWLDSGFFFQVEADGVRSPAVGVDIEELPELTVTSSTAGTVAAHVVASPAEPWLPVQVQQQAPDGSWATVASGNIADDGTFDQAVTAVTPGAHAYRAWIGGDPVNGVLAGYSAARNVTVAGSAVGFTRVQYAASTVNGEWFRVTNAGTQSADLSGWTARDAQNHVYTFSAGYRLGAGQSVYVRTGRGTNSTTQRYWGRTAQVWDDRGDTATLRSRDGRTVDTCRWPAGSGATAC